ncbi:MAG: hypothetical protein JWQ97_4158 [Phenylobacterium sp.]|nr:hypothetical protein [Phenylobacterium sp.]
MDVTADRAHRAWTNAERISRVSDGLINFGPWGLGLDGVLAWIPGANVLYSVGAGGLLMYEAVAARASSATLIRMGLYLTANTALDGVPVVGWALDTLFRGHAFAAGALQKDIEARHGLPQGAQPRRRWRWGLRTAGTL